MLKKELVLLSIPLVLAGFTHLYNSAGFYTFQQDEGHYMRKALVVLNGISLQDKPGIWDAYHAPFFGQILLGKLLQVSGYPNFVMSQTTSSVELAIAFPRMLMGIFAIIDTFLVFKISQRNCNIQVALFASTLFAVTPMTWITRLITLDTIALPFLLTSILVALNISKWNQNGNVDKNIVLVLLAGTALGLAILTKLPLLTMIPLVGYLIYKNSTRVKHGSPIMTILVWLIPIFLIPSVWPLYAILVHEFDLWEKQLLDQATRERRPIIETFFNIDSMLFFLGLSGLIYSFARRDWILILWITPFILFVYVIGWFLPWHWIIVFPAFCVAGARFVIELSQKVKFARIKKSPTIIMICTIIIGIGLFNTIMLMERNFESHAIKGITDSLDYLDRADGLDDDKIDEKITVISPTAYSWFYKYIHNLNYTLDTDADTGRQAIKTQKTIILQNRPISKILNVIASPFVLDLGTVQEICSLDIYWYTPGLASRPSLIVTIANDTDSLSNIIFKANNRNITKNPERIDLNNNDARFINITVFHNTGNGYGGIKDVKVNGRDANSAVCKTTPIKTIINFDVDYPRVFTNFDAFASYQKLIHDTKNISKYESDIDDLNSFTKLFSPNQYNSRILELKANY